MPDFKYTPDSLEIHSEGAIKQLVRSFGSHEAGIPEWAKNSADAYARKNTSPKERYIVIIMSDSRRKGQTSISCLDFVGMSSGDIDTFFRIWADPEAAGRGRSGVSGIQGGHGNGGKAYMSQMFDEFAYIYTTRRSKGCRYGVPSGKYIFGYMPNPDKGRDFEVHSLEKELEIAAFEAGFKIDELPELVKKSINKAEGFTLVRGVNPKGYQGRIPVAQLMESVMSSPQMIVTLQLCKVYVVYNGKLFNEGKPLNLPEITPLEGAEKPREIVIPESLVDPISNQEISTTSDLKYPNGRIFLRTSYKV